MDARPRAGGEAQPSAAARERLAVALDVPDLDAAARLLERIGDLAAWVKVGSALFTAAGPAALDLAARHGRVFLDTKLHDIPNTVVAAVRAAAERGVAMLTLHAAGGPGMLGAAREAIEGLGAARPALVAVTVLTSFDEGALGAVGVAGSLDAQVERLAVLALDAGLDGVVASPREAALLRRRIRRPFRLVTPGVRAEPSRDDQARTATCEDAIRAGSDLLVVGRPIVAAPEPRAAMLRYLRAIDRALA